MALAGHPRAMKSELFSPQQAEGPPLPEKEDVMSNITLIFYPSLAVYLNTALLYYGIAA